MRVHALFTLCIATGCHSSTPTSADAATTTTPSALDASVVVQPTPSPSSSVKPLTQQDRTKILAAITKLQALVVKRRATLRIESEEICDARHAGDPGPLVSAAIDQIGDTRLGTTQTRFASAAPNIGQTIMNTIFSCFTGCIEHVEDVPDSETIQESQHDCDQAATALADLTEQIKSAP